MLTEKIITKLNEIESIQQEMQLLHKQAHEFCDSIKGRVVSSEEYMKYGDYITLGQAKDNVRPIYNREGELLKKVRLLIQEVSKLMADARQEKDNWLKNVAASNDSGDPEELYAQSARYVDGGTPQDMVRAFDLCKKAAESDVIKWSHKKEHIAQAQHQLSMYYALGEGGTPQDPQTAFYWMEKAGENGNIDAIGRTGDHYCNGFGVAKDEARGVALFRRAAEMGDMQAAGNLTFKLGRMAFEKRDFESLQEAISWGEKLPPSPNLDKWLDIMKQKRDEINADLALRKQAVQTLTNIIKPTPPPSLLEPIATHLSEIEHICEVIYSSAAVEKALKDANTLDALKEENGANLWNKKYKFHENFDKVLEHIDSCYAMLDKIGSSAEADNLRRRADSCKKHIDSMDKLVQTYIGPY